MSAISPIGEGSPQGAEQKVPDKAIGDARGGIPGRPRPAAEGAPAGFPLLPGLNRN
jgi:hypothetical protein